MNPYCEEIQNLCGQGELKAFAEKLMLTSQNAKSRRISYPPLPTLVFLTSSGNGVTTAIRLLTGLLREEKLMRFVGEEEYFETALTDREHFFDQILARVDIAAGFYSQFRGVVGVHLREADTGLFESDPFQRMMEYVDLQQGKILFVFILPQNTDAKTLSSFQRLFLSRTPVETIYMPFPETEDILRFIAVRLEQRQMSFSGEAAVLMKKAVGMLRKSPEFEGFQSLKNLIDEMIWRKISSENGQDGRLSAQDLEPLFRKNGLIAMTQSENQRNRMRKIGFGMEENGMRQRGEKA